MTTITVERIERERMFPLRRITATGHAGDRDACIATTFTLRTFAHMLQAHGYLESVEQVQEPPRFCIEGVGQGYAKAMMDEAMWLLERLVEQYPGHLKIERYDDVRYAGNGLRESA